MFRRRIDDRVTSLAPFLTTDADPYAVVIDGRIKWVVDAYTTSDRFPYSNTPEQTDLAPAATDAPPSGEVVAGVNYVRNSVKAVVDAYDGDVTLYAMDESDPILAAWSDIFPDLFTSQKQMPDEVRAHLRYPEDLFEVQSSLWRRYHMSDVSDFYQREDEWAIPTIDNADMQSYYVLAKLPGAEKEELLLIRPLHATWQEEHGGVHGGAERRQAVRRARYARAVDPGADAGTIPGAGAHQAGLGGRQAGARVDHRQQPGDLR